MSTGTHELTIRFADLGDVARIELPDPRSEEAIQDLLNRAGSGSLRVAAYGGDDTTAHIASNTLTVVLSGGDDVEGHAMSLRFPTAAEAKDFQKRLLATGAIAATIVVGAATAQLATQSPGQVAAPAGPAIVQPAPAPDVAPGLAGEIKGGQVAPSVATPSFDRGAAAKQGPTVEAPSFDRGAAAKQGPTVEAPSFDRGAAAKQGPTVEAPSFDRGAAVHNAGQSTTLPDGWQTSRRHFPQEAAPAASVAQPDVAPGVAAEIKAGDVGSGEEAGAAEEGDTYQRNEGTFRGE